jgi:hypothetical protein
MALHPLELQSLLAWFAARGLSAACPVCGGEGFGAEKVSLPMAPESGAPAGNVIRAVAMVCARCAHLRLLTLNALGQQGGMTPAGPQPIGPLDATPDPGPPARDAPRTGD